MSTPETRPQSVRLLSPTPFTDAEYQVSSRHLTQTQLDALGNRLVKVGSFRGATRILPIGTDDPDETFAVRAYGVDRYESLPAVGQVATPMYELSLVGTATVTLGTLQFSADPVPPIAELAGFYRADTIAWEAGPLGTFLQSMFGRAPVAVDDTNGVARLGIPDLGNLWGLLFDFNMDTAASANLLLSLGT